MTVYILPFYLIKHFINNPQYQEAGKMSFNNYSLKQHVIEAAKHKAQSSGPSCNNKTAKKYLVNYFFAAIFFLISTNIMAHSALAAGVMVSWDMDTEPDIESYRVLYGTESRSYGDSITVTNPQDNPGHLEQSIQGLYQGKTYFFSVRAIDRAGQESDLSQETSISIPYNFDPGALADHMDEIEWLESGKSDIDSQWKTITLSRFFARPVVIISPPTMHDATPCVIRIKDVTSNSFDIKIQEWDYLDGTHQSETISYIVVEAGTYHMPDGTVWQAGTYELSGTRDFSQVDFPEEFLSIPVVFQTAQTENDTAAISIREKEISTTGFSAAMEEEESMNQGHVTETIGFLAMEKNMGGNHVIDVARANHDLFTPSDASDIYLKLDEEQSRDSETNHTYEDIGYMIIGDIALSQIQTYNGPDTSSMRLILKNGTISDTWYLDASWLETGSISINHEWITVSLNRTFSSPVVIAGPPSYQGGDPCVIRIRNVTPDSFEIRIQEWDYKDGAHTHETVSYMVIEEGMHTLPDGTIWEAGTYDMDGTNQWTPVALEHQYGMAPVIFLSTQSFHDEQAITTRLKNITGSGFSTAFQEEESLNDGHAYETVGYLAAPLTSPCHIGLKSINHVFTQMGYNLPWMFLEEEQSKDSEKGHVYESTAYLSLGPCFFGQIETFSGADTVALRMK